MNKKKGMFDVIFIVITAIFLIVLQEYGLIEKYIGLALLPILAAYYIGQFVERKTALNQNNEVIEN